MSKLDEILSQDKPDDEILQDLYNHEEVVGKWLDENENDCDYTKGELHKKYKKILDSIVKYEKKRCN